MSLPMSPERWKKIESVFEAALEVPADHRQAFIQEACGGDEAMSREVEALLTHDQAAADFIEAPAVPGARSLSEIAAGMSGESMTGQRLGSYRIEEEIGRGGMGTVYRAVRDDGEFTQDVAVKIVKKAMATPSMLDRFRRERQILAMLNHPNIARVLDGGSTEDGQPYFVMELIDGKPITGFCSERAIGLRPRLRLFLSVCAAVANAHQSLIIHRDLKPANILVTRTGEVKLLDFGIAKMFQHEETDPADTISLGEAPLTPEYASPEQVRNERVTTATDVYALGLILYEMLTGRKAQRLPSASMLEIERTVCLTEPRRPSDVMLEGASYSASKLRGDLDNIISKAIQKDPARRYSTVNQLAEDIERYLDGRPVKARPDSFLYSAGKFVRRNKIAVAAVVVATCSLVSGVAAAAWEARVARQHFNLVRSLAKSLLTEINPAIADVSGATKARHLIVQRSLEYLDKLSQTAPKDPILLRELAEAYEAVATIQGNRNKSNLGDYSGSMVSFRKALAIRDRIESLAPSANNRQWISMIRAEAARVYPNSDEALRLASGAVEIAQQLSRESPKRYAVPLGNAYFGLGYVHSRREEPEQAIPCFEKTFELGELARRSKNNLSVCDRYISSCYLLLDKPQQALERATRGRITDEERIQAEPNPRAFMDLSYDYQALASASLALGRLEDALEWARKAEKIRRQQAADDPDDQRATTALPDGDEVMGMILARIGKKKESLDYLEKAIEAREGFVAEAPESPEDRYDLARAYASAGRVYLQFGMCARAGEVLSKARTIFEEQHQKISLRGLDSMPACSAR